MRKYLILLILLFPYAGWAQTPPTNFTTASGAGWTQGSGVATAPASFSYINYNTAFGPNQQAACVISAIPAEGGTLHVTFRYESTSNRIRLILTRVAGSNNDTLTLGEVVDGTINTFQGPTSLGVDIQVGDKVGVKVASNVISGNYQSVDAAWATLCAGGGDWCTVVSGTASRTPASSYIGLGGTTPVACTSFLGEGDAVAGDTTAPLPNPPTWTATPTIVRSQTQIELAANACTDDVGIVSYNFETCDGSGCSDFGTPVIDPNPSPAILVSGLTANTLYRFRFRCYDGTNYSASYSATQDATTFTNADTTNPTAPTNPTAARTIGSSSIVSNATVTWTVATDVGGSGVVTHHIERGDSACANFVEIGQVGNVGTFTDGDIDIPITAGRCYRIRAKDFAGNTSDYSDNVKLYPVHGGHMR